MGLLLPICSCLVLFSLAQSNQDQGQPTATIDLRTSYIAESKITDIHGACEDNISVNYTGSVRYKLLPGGYGTAKLYPENLSTHPGPLHSERNGQISLNVSGGGHCTSSGGSMVWTNSAPDSQVAPKDYPEIDVHLKSGRYNVTWGPDPIEGVRFKGVAKFEGGVSAPIDSPGPPYAQDALRRVQMKAAQKVAEALGGKFPPFSKGFSASNSVSDSIAFAEPNRTGSASMNISYTLTVGTPEDVEAIIIPPDDYEDWIPQGSQEVQAPSGPAPPVEPPPIAAAIFGGSVMLASLANLASLLPPAGGLGQGAGPAVMTAVEDLVGNKLENVKVVLQKKGQKGSKTAQGARFRVELVDTSHEPGVCLNWPPKDQVKIPSPFDLEIDVKNNPIFEPLKPGDTYPQAAVTHANNLHELKFSILSHDYGAYGKLKVTFQLQDGSGPFDAHLKDKPNVTEMTIPLDDNGNHIADKWEKDNGVFEKNLLPDSDDDSIPEGKDGPGDGLSLYEEYRGFMVSGQHKRTNPNIKDLFVYDKSGFGKRNFDDFLASLLDFHLVSNQEFYKDPNTQTPNPYVINFNHKTGHLVDEHVLILQDACLDKGVTGLTPLGPPKNLPDGAVKVDQGECMDTKWGQEELNHTIAHELAHCCHVGHHGPSEFDIPNGDYITGWVQHRNDDGTWVYISRGDHAYTIAVPGGARSGDQQCIMRYNAADFYVCPGGSYRWQGGKEKWTEGWPYPPFEDPGANFCLSKEGTGTNVPPEKPYQYVCSKAGNATWGECLQQFCVNDLKY
jgi:hypothetical protein